MVWGKTKMKIRIIKKEVVEEISISAGVAGYGAPMAVNTDEKKDLEEMYSTSGAMMGAGSGEIPKERNPKAHKRYVRIRFTQQGLQNFKPSPYFPDRIQQLGEKKKKKRKGASKSYCKSTSCKDMGFTQKASCKSQGIKDCYRGKKKN